MRRMRRLRHPGIRDLVAETRLSLKSMIQPMFIDEKLSEPKAIESMPGQFRHSLESIQAGAGALEDLGVPAILLFGLPAQKDEIGSAACDPEGIIQKAVRKIKEITDLIVITDLCLCEYTSHGHCGLIRDDKVLNDETLTILGEIAVNQAAAGADIIAPSGMMDHMVHAIRAALDLDDIWILPFFLIRLSMPPHSMDLSERQPSQVSSSEIEKGIRWILQMLQRRSGKCNWI